MSPSANLTSGRVYNIGDRVELDVSFTNASTGAPANPTSVTLTLQSPDGTQTAYDSTTTPAVLNPITGSYTFQFITAESGVDATTPAYLYRWTGTGLVAKVVEGYIFVSPTILTPQPPPSPAFTLDDLQTLNAAISSGAMEVRFQDRTVRYRSMQEMLTARNYVFMMLKPNSINRMVRIHTLKGL